MAREAVCKALQLVEYYGDTYVHHGLIFLLLMYTPNREQFVLFACGHRRRAELPVVLHWAAKFFFVVINSRWVEGMHSRIHGAALVRRNASAATVGLTLHAPYINEYMSESVENLARLANNFDSVRTPAGAVRSLGFENHPTAQKVVNKAKVITMRVGAIVQIL